jgi:hypothetical protein
MVVDLVLHDFDFCTRVEVHDHWLSVDGRCDVVVAAFVLYADADHRDLPERERVVFLRLRGRRVHFLRRRSTFLLRLWRLLSSVLLPTNCRLVTRFAARPALDSLAMIRTTSAVMLHAATTPATAVVVRGGLLWSRLIARRFSTATLGLL